MNKISNKKIYYYIKSSDIKTRRFGDDMPPLSNANYNNIVNVIYTIVSGKLDRINEAGINKRMEKLK